MGDNLIAVFQRRWCPWRALPRAVSQALPRVLPWGALLTFSCALGFEPRHAVQPGLNQVQWQAASACPGTHHVPGNPFAGLAVALSYAKLGADGFDGVFHRCHFLCIVDADALVRYSRLGHGPALLSRAKLQSARVTSSAAVHCHSTINGNRFISRVYYGESMLRECDAPREKKRGGREPFFFLLRQTGIGRLHQPAIDRKGG